MSDEDQEAVRILPYDEEAPKIFEEVKRFVLKEIPCKIEVEHIGSTAVPGLGGRA